LLTVAAGPELVGQVHALFTTQAAGG